MQMGLLGRVGCAVAIAACAATLTVKADDTPYAKVWRAMGVSGTASSATASLAQFNDTGSVAVRSGASAGVVKLIYTITAVDGVIWAGNPTFPDTLCLGVTARAENDQSRVRVTLYERNLNPSFGQNPVSLGVADTAAIGFHGTGYGSFGNCNLHEANSSAPLLKLDFTEHVSYLVAELIKTGTSGNPGLMAVSLGHEQP
jgi:hypothetical protein